MKLIFLSGLPGVGKLTVGRELAGLTGYKLFHNHLSVDWLVSVFEFGSPPFVQLRESIWLSVFEQAQEAKMPGLIFTFCPEKTVRQTFIDNTRKTISAGGGDAIFIELCCGEKELERRLDTPERRGYAKLTSLAQFREMKAAGIFSSPKLPPPQLCVDTGSLDPKAAARLILKECELPEAPRL